MVLFQRARASLRRQGLTASVAKLHSIFLDHWHDFRYGLDTCSISELRDLTIRTGRVESGYIYRPVRLLALRKFFKSIAAELPSREVLVDIGSGKGRILLAAAELGFREARGIEFARELCEIAQRNCARYQAATGTATVFHTLEGDAAQYAFRPDESVFVFCNPFAGDIMARVLANLATSLRTHPRRIMVIYYNPTCRTLVEQQSWLVPHREFIWCGHEFMAYVNRS